MRKFARIALAAFIATAALAALVSSASARNFSTSNQNFRVVWTSLEFSQAGVLTIRCRLTLEGSFHSRTIAKVERSLLGYVTIATIQHPCTGGEFWTYNGIERLGTTTLANSLPWHISYERFTGTLPSITTITILFAGFRIRFRNPVFGELCIYTSGARGNVSGTATNQGAGVFDNMVLSGRITPDTGSGGACPNPFGVGSRAEDGRLTLLGTTTRITLTLI